MLAPWQQQLYWNVMKENYETLSFLNAGRLGTLPELLATLGQVFETWEDQQNLVRRANLESSYLGVGVRKPPRKESNRKQQLSGNFPGEQGKTGSHTPSHKKSQETNLLCPGQMDNLVRIDPTGSRRDHGVLHSLSPGERALMEKIQNQELASENELSLKPHHCPECGKHFKRQHELKVHKRVHTKERPFPCPECGKCFRQKSALMTHQWVHSKERPFTCPECGRCFAQKQYLRKHQWVHRNERPFHCTQCGRCFTQKQYLKKHQHLHSGERPFACSECGRHFAQKQDLKKHQHVHSGERPFPCPECGRHFAQKQDLKRHQRVHSGERPFPCAECGHHFSQKQDLKKHQRVHTGEHPFLCPQCGHHFAQKQGLKKHLQVHQRAPGGKRPFPCLECERSFTRMYDLKKHQRSIHSSEHFFACPGWDQKFSNMANNSISLELIKLGPLDWDQSQCGRSDSTTWKVFEFIFLPLDHSLLSNTAGDRIMTT
ncbi:uncharacterized protein LOC141542895 isoform X4 [Sminthopsis crassicaudata]